MFLWRMCHLKYLSFQTCWKEVPHSIGQRQGNIALGLWRRNCKKLLGSKICLAEKSLLGLQIVPYIHDGRYKQIFRNTWMCSNIVLSVFAVHLHRMLFFRSLYPYMWRLNGLPFFSELYDQRTLHYRDDEIRHGFESYGPHLCYANCNCK